MDQLKMLKLLRRDTAKRICYLFEVSVWDICLALQVDNGMLTRMHDVETKFGYAADAHRKLVDELVMLIDSKISELENAPVAAEVTE